MRPKKRIKEKVKKMPKKRNKLEIFYFTNKFFNCFYFNEMNYISFFI